MEIEHFVTFYSHSALKPQVRTEKMETDNVKKIRYPLDAYRAVLYDRISSKVYYGDRVYTCYSNKLNQKTYYIGTFVKIQDYKNKDSTMIALEKQAGCIGVVTDYNGIEHFVFEGDGVIDTKKRVLTRCTAPIDEKIQSPEDIEFNINMLQ